MKKRTNILRKILLTFILLVQISVSLFAQSKPAYIIYNSNGKKVSYAKMHRAAAASDMVLFGEQHNNAIAHWLQLELTKDLLQERALTLGAEMFEADNQDALNQYLSGNITAKKLDSVARLWPNFTTDYKPLVDIAKDSHLVFAATNIPRRHASLVAKGGFERLDTISTQEKKWIAPLPIAYDSTLSQYENMIQMMGGHGGANMPKAQAIKDATMAYFILQNYKPDNLFIHFNGAYHSDYYQGILWYLKNEQPDLMYITISTVTQTDISSLDEENIGKADFIICVDEDVTTTY